MRILHVDTGAEMRGGQWQALYLLHGLRERGHEGTLVAREDGPLAARARQAGFVVVPYGEKTPAKGDSFDILHAHDAKAHTWALWNRIATLVVARRVAFPVKRGFLSRWKYKFGHFIAISQFVAKKLSEAGIEEHRITVVYDGVPALRPAEPTGSIVAPATEDPQKGTAIVRQTGLPVVYAQDLGKELPGASVFVYLSYEEGLGSGVLLAMSGGIPVVASRVGGLLEAVDHGKTGLLVENDPKIVERAVRHILGNAEVARQMSQAARARYQSMFTIQKMVAGTEEVYRKVLG